MLFFLLSSLQIFLNTPHESVPLNVQVPKTHEERTLGLSQTHSLSSKEGMLFVMNESDIHFFTMKETPIDLAFFFFDENKVLTEVFVEKAYSPHPVYPNKPTQYVLEASPSLLNKYTFPLQKTRLVIEE